MRYFIDTEFYERGPDHPIELISLAIVAEDGRDFYAIKHGFDWDSASEWLKDNVLPHVYKSNAKFGCGGGREHIIKNLSKFINGDPQPEFWGYYSDYDWVVFCQLFGSMTDLPETFPYYCRDLRQWLDERGLQSVIQPTDTEHNALSDAHWVRDTYLYHQNAPLGH